MNGDDAAYLGAGLPRCAQNVYWRGAGSRGDSVYSQTPERALACTHLLSLGRCPRLLGLTQDAHQGLRIDRWRSHKGTRWLGVHLGAYLAYFSLFRGFRGDRVTSFTAARWDVHARGGLGPTRLGFGVHLGAYLAYALPFLPDRVVGWAWSCLLPLCEWAWSASALGCPHLGSAVQQGERAPRTREHPSPLRVGTSMLTQCTQGVETA